MCARHEREQGSCDEILERESSSIGRTRIGRRGFRSRDAIGGGGGGGCSASADHAVRSHFLPFGEKKEGF